VRGEPTFHAAACTWSDDDDRELVARWCGGDRKAFTLLVVRYQKTLYNTAFWIVRRHEDASDVAQTVFLKVAERADDYDPRYRFFSWIYRIAVNEALNLVRRAGHEAPLDDDHDAAGPDGDGPEGRLDAAERARGLRAALLRMSVNDRVVLTLRHFSECSYDEMAAILAIDEKTVKSRLFDARRRLRLQLADLPAESRA
jgi:RNA polymerase sigma-70 factor (ECF subfamily)